MNNAIMSLTRSLYEELQVNKTIEAVREHGNYKALLTFSLGLLAGLLFGLWSVV